MMVRHARTWGWKALTFALATLFMVFVVAAPGTVSALDRPAFPDRGDEEGDDDEKKDEEEPVDPVESATKIKEMMDQAESLLDQLKTGKKTQAEQNRIIAEIQKLIDELNNRRGGGGGGNQNRQQQRRQQRDQQRQGQQSDSDQQRQSQRQPMKKDLSPPPKGGRSDNIRRQEQRKPPPQVRRTPLRKGGANVHERWGLLPPREREDRLHQRREDVPERFRDDVDKYRKRLADPDDE